MASSSHSSTAHKADSTPDRLARLVGGTWREGNNFTILQNGDAIFPAMLSAIRASTRSIEFLSYVFWRSDIATEFTQALAERARAGVKVSVLVDAFGGARMSSRAIWMLERAGVNVGWYHPGRWQYLWMLNNRTHRKILVVDGRIGFTGGVGIAEPWTGNAQDSEHFRETHCKIEGPAVLDLHAGFADNWPDSSQTPPPLPSPAGDISVLTTISRAAERPTAALHLVGSAIDISKVRLWITSAYFVPGPLVLAGLIAAAGRGVDVRVLTNGNLSNHHMTTLAGRATYAPLLTSGVRIFEYARTVHHSKVIAVDSVWATIGSTNVDARSLVLNDEINVSIRDRHLIHDLEMQFEQDLTDADEIKLASWSRRSRLVKLAESGLSVFAGQL